MAEPALRLSNDVIYRPLAQGGGVLLHLESGEYHSVNSTGATVCSLLDGHRTLAQVQRDVVAQHTDAPEDVAEDVQQFVAALTARGLIATG